MKPAKKDESVEGCQKVHHPSPEVGSKGAKKWWDIIDWEDKDATIYEPAILSKMDNDELKEVIIMPINFPHFPLHSQSVERGVKLVSEAARLLGGKKDISIFCL